MTSGDTMGRKYKKTKLADFLDTNSTMPGAKFEEKKQESTYSGDKTQFPRTKTKSGKFNSGEVFDFFSLIKEWEELVGPRLFSHTLPKKFVRGTLTVLCSHPAWAKELSLAESALQAQIKKKFPAISSSLKSIVFLNSPGELKRIQLAFAGFDNENQGQIKEQNFHKHNPNFLKLQEQAKKVLAVDNNEKNIEDEMKEMLISIYVQSKNNKN